MGYNLIRKMFSLWKVIRSKNNKAGIIQMNFYSNKSKSMKNKKLQKHRKSNKQRKKS